MTGSAPDSAAVGKPSGDLSTTSPPAGRRPRVIAWFVLMIALGLFADLASKWAAFRFIDDRPFVVNRQAVLRVLADDPSRIMALVPDHEAVHAVPGLLDFRLVLNAGAVFGTGQGRRWMFIGFTSVILVIAAYAFFRWTRANEKWTHFALAMVIAGGLGNLYDRVVLGCVRDFIHPLPGVRFPQWFLGGREVWPYVSNVADALLLVGIAILTVKLWRADSGKKPERTAEHNPS